MPPIPVIRLSVESMKHQILHALTEYELTLSDELKQAVEAFCTPENLKAIMQREVQTVISQAVREEVERYYRHGDGRAAVQRAVEEALHR